MLLVCSGWSVKRPRFALRLAEALQKIDKDYYYYYYYYCLSHVCDRSHRGNAERLIREKREEEERVLAEARRLEEERYVSASI